MNKPVIMVVDDSEIILSISRIHLEEAGFEVITRSKSFGTTDEIIRRKPDCVLLDISMPGLTGDSITKIIREKKLDTMIVLFSAKEENELLELANECGADGYIKKSENKYKFINKVKSFISSSPKKVIP